MPPANESAASALLPDFEEGQIWEYETRPCDTNSVLQIIKIEPNPVNSEEENLKYGRIIHISVKNIKVKFLGTNDPQTTDLGHSPIFEIPLRKCVTRLVGKSVEECDLEGYNLWKKNKGGVLFIPVKEIISCLGVAFAEK